MINESDNGVGRLFSRQTRELLLLLRPDKVIGLALEIAREKRSLTYHQLDIAGHALLVYLAIVFAALSWAFDIEVSFERVFEACAYVIVISYVCTFVLEVVKLWSVSQRRS